MLQRPKNLIENRGEMLQRSDISQKNYGGQARNGRPPRSHFVGSIMENAGTAFAQLETI